MNIDECVHNLFKVPIWGFTFNNETYHLDDYVSKILKMKETEPSINKSNMGGGWQSRDDLNTTEGIFKELVTSINDVAKDICKHHYSINNGAGFIDVEVKEMWANVNPKYSYNGNHIHSGILSGAFYLKVPQNSGSLVLVNPSVRSDTKLFKSDDFKINPKELSCIFFPSWLEHYVQQNMNDEDRISISFNIGIRNSYGSH
jgi:uncharacterized protein (TIGR02466 family)